MLAVVVTRWAGAVRAGPGRAEAGQTGAAQERETREADHADHVDCTAHTKSSDMFFLCSSCRFPGRPAKFHLGWDTVKISGAETVQAARREIHQF